MDLNSPVKMMLPQDMKTPLVPDSEMYSEPSTVCFAGDKRKAWPDAKRVPIPDSEYVFVFTQPEETLEFFYDPEDFEGLEKAVAVYHDSGIPEYDAAVGRLKEMQRSFGVPAVRSGGRNNYGGKLLMKVVMDKKRGRVVYASRLG